MWDMKSLFCEDRNCPKNIDKLCVRRVMGTVGFLSSIIAVFIGVSHDALQLLMLVSTSLLGLTTIDKFVKN